MGITLRRPSSRKDISDCINLYLERYDSSIFPVSPSKGEQELFLAVRMGKFVLMAEEDQELIGWIYAKEVDVPHLDYKVLNQMYYASNATGFKAIKLLKILHEEMYEYAESNKFEILMSGSSYEDSTYVLSRALAKYGWSSKGSMAIRKTKHFKEK